MNDKKQMRKNKGVARRLRMSTKAWGEKGIKKIDNYEYVYRRDRSYSVRDDESLGFEELTAVVADLSAGAEAMVDKFLKKE